MLLPCSSHHGDDQQIGIVFIQSNHNGKIPRRAKVFHPAFHKHGRFVDLCRSLHDAHAKTFKYLYVTDRPFQHSFLRMVCEKHPARIPGDPPNVCLQLRIAHADKGNSITHKNYGLSSGFCCL